MSSTIDEYLLVAGAMIFNFRVFGALATHNVALEVLCSGDVWQNLLCKFGRSSSCQDSSLLRPLP
jgi:hypothetical protein